MEVGALIRTQKKHQLRVEKVPAALTASNEEPQRPTNCKATAMTDRVWEVHLGTHELRPNKPLTHSH